VYTVAIWLIARLMPNVCRRACDWLGGRLSGWGVLLWPVLLLAVVRIALVERFEATHALVDDWYNHAQYFFLFVTGAMLAMQNGFWAKVDGLRWTSLGLWLVTWALVVIYWSIPEALHATPQVAQWKPVMRAVYCLGQWTPILAICGFGHRHLGFDSAKRRYLTEAVFPVYILHQTLIVTMAHWLKPVKLAPGIEGGILIVLTFAISFGGFEVMRRVAVLRPLFGLGPRQPAAAAPAGQAQLPAAI